MYFFLNDVCYFKHPWLSHKSVTSDLSELTVADWDFQGGCQVYKGERT